jgi:hypothetical protein
VAKKKTSTTVPTARRRTLVVHLNTIVFGCSGDNDGNARLAAASVSLKQQSTDDRGKDTVMTTLGDNDQWGRRGT